MVDAEGLRIAMSGLFAIGFALVAWGGKVLDGLGSLLACALALVILLAPGLDGFDGFRWLGLLVFFVLVGFVITKMFWQVKTAKMAAEGKKGVRGWRNVAANGLVPSGLALLTAFLEPSVVAIGFVAAVATASSDTFASELGILSDKTYLITNPRKRVPPGTNGGVSTWGHFVALVGSAFPSVVGFGLLGLPWSMVWVPIVAGWLGCQVDSVLGALFEEERGRVYGFMSKSDVNFLAILSASFGVLVVLGA